MATLPVYVIGFGDLYHEFFNSIATTMDSNDYHKLFKLMVIRGRLSDVIAIDIFEHFLTEHLMTLKAYMSLGALPPKLVQSITQTMDHAILQLHQHTLSAVSDPRTTSFNR